MLHTFTYRVLWRCYPMFFDDVDHPPYLHFYRGHAWALEYLWDLKSVRSQICGVVTANGRCVMLRSGRIVWCAFDGVCCMEFPFYCINIMQNVVATAIYHLNSLCTVTFSPEFLIFYYFLLNILFSSGIKVVFLYNWRVQGPQQHICRKHHLQNYYYCVVNYYFIIRNYVLYMQKGAGRKIQS